MLSARRRSYRVMAASLLALPFVLAAEARPEAPSGGVTIVTPYLDAPIPEGRSILYCASFQLVRDALRGVVGGDIQLEEPLDLVSELNRRDRLEPAEDAVALGGWAGDGIVDRINRALLARWGRGAPLITDRPRDPTEIWCCGYLRAELRFEHRFEALQERFLFRWGGHEATVRVFGVHGLERSQRGLADQVLVLDERSDSDFVVSLRSTKANDELILARVPPSGSLAETWASVSTRIAGSVPERLREDDSLTIPMVRLELVHSFTELQGKHLANPGLEGYFFHTAEQSVSLRLDEAGASVSSRSVIALKKGPQPRKLELLGPFLLVLRRRGAGEPYLALWVGDGAPLDIEAQPRAS